MFSLLTVEEIMRIIDLMRYIDIDEEKILFNEGDDGNELFIVKSGRIASFVRLPNGNRREIAEFKTGDFFGEMSIFENAPRSATCYAREKSILFSLRERDFFELILYNPDIATKIMYRMLNIATERLQEKSEFLSDMFQWGEEARRRAITDELTGIYNRRYLDDALDEYFEKAKNSNKSMSIMMIDIDHFREINEIYSHEQVDQAIIAVVSTFKKHLREKDIFARYGGDEFTVILPETSLEDAKLIANKICRDVAALNLVEVFNGDKQQVTISLGIASYPESTEDLETLCNIADQSLYKAKEEGKNRVVCLK